MLIWTNLKKANEKYHIGKIVIALVIILFLDGCASQNNGFATKKNFKQITSNKVSFVNQVKSPATHVWVQAKGDSVSKDSIVSTIYVLKNRKLQAYQIFDNNITLGKLSSMSDSKAIELAKKQDKKYTMNGAIKEINNYLKQKDGQIGQETDFDDNTKTIASGGLNIYYTFQEDDTNKYQQQTVKNIYKTSAEAQRAAEDEGLSNGSSDLLSLSDNALKKDQKVDTNFGRAIIKHIENTKYQPPMAQKLKVKNTTDDTGNKIVSQTVTYTAVDMFDSKQAETTLYNYVMKHKVDFIKLLTLASSYGYGMNSKDISGYMVFGSDGWNPSELSAYKSQITQFSAEGNDLYDQLLNDKYNDLTKGVYGYHKWSKAMTISDSISQKIYKARYVGYVTTKGYLLTKTQNSKQKATISN